MKKKINLIIWVVAATLLLVAAYLVYSKSQPGKNESNATPTTTVQEKEIEQAKESTEEKEKVFAPEFSLQDMEGNTVKLSDFRGKIVILNFWAVWCKYCVQEMPDFNDLNQSLIEENDVVILAINSQESKDKVKGFLDKNKLSLKVLLDTDGAVTQAYGITGFPTTFVLNRDGSLYTYVPGATTKESLEEIISKVKALPEN